MLFRSGVIYNSGEQNSVVQAKEVKKLAEEKGAQVVEASVSTSAEVKQATESLVGRVDAIYVPTDNTVVSALDAVIAEKQGNKSYYTLTERGVDRMEEAANRIIDTGFVCER